MSKPLPEGIRRLARPGDPVDPKTDKVIPSGRYQARYSVTVNGRSVQKSAGTFARLQDAKDARNLALAELKQGTWVDPRGPRMTFEDWTTEWQQLRNKYEVRTRSYLKVHILPVFGQQRLGDITPPEVQHWVRGLERKDSINATTVRTIYQLFKSILETAVDMDVLPKSPCRAVQLPKASRPKRTGLSVEQVHALEAAAKGLPRGYRSTTSFAPMIHLCAWAGLRWQECAALRWENVDLSAGTLTICEAVKAETKKIGTTKSDRQRVVHIGPTTVTRLTEHRRDFGGEGLLFPGRFGQHQDYGSFRVNVWYKILDAAGVPRCGTHALRHFYAGLMVASGVDPKVLSETMGHATPSFTLDRYGLPRSDGGVVLVAAVEEAMKR